MLTRQSRRLKLCTVHCAWWPSYIRVGTLCGRETLADVQRSSARSLWEDLDFRRLPSSGVPAVSEAKPCPYSGYSLLCRWFNVRCGGAGSLPGPLTIASQVTAAPTYAQQDSLPGSATRLGPRHRAPAALGCCSLFTSPFDTRDQPVNQWEIVKIYKSRPRPLTLSRS